MYVSKWGLISKHLKFGPRVQCDHFDLWSGQKRRPWTACLGDHLILGDARSGE